MALLAFHDVYKRFNTVEVLHGVSFTLDQGTVLGLIGENGSGKSTCMNIVGGVLPLTGGHMTLDGQPYRPGNVRDASKAGIAFIHQELNLFENLSIEENIFINDFPRPLPFVPWILRRRVRDETRRLLDLVELAKNPGTKISQLSQGERQLVEIAKALRTDSRIIIFDEPTTSLTRHECQQLFGIINRLRGREIGVIYISHILDDVLRLADAIVVLRDGQVAASGPAEGTDASQLVRHMVGREIEKLYPTRGVIVSNDNALEVDELSRPGFVRNISLRIRKGEIVGLAGRMGSGRTELARMLFGLDRFSSGRIRVHGREIPRPTPARCAAMGMALVTEDRRGEGLLMPAKIQPNVSVASLREHAWGPIGYVNQADLASEARRSADEIGLGHELRLGKLARNLSGGNQQKVVLAKWLIRAPSVLILDEPTRGIDIGAKQEIYQSIMELANRGSAILIISSEMEELTGMCDRIAVMNRGEIVEQISRPDFSVERLTRTVMRNREGASA